MKSTVVIFLLSIFGFAAAAHADDSVVRGKVVYGKYCSKCHGVNADGQGKDAYKYKPAPTNFRIAQAPLSYFMEIIKNGGKGVSRSDNMPDWDGDLSPQQIEDVANYAVSVRKQ